MDNVFVNPASLPPITINNSTNVTGTARDLLTTDGLIVSFYPVVEEDDVAVEVLKMGEVRTERRRKNTHYIKIRPAGQNLNIVEREVTPQDQIRFKEAWKAYIERREFKQAGTPLHAWKDMPSSYVRLLEDNEIYTVEQFLKVPDSGVSAMSGDLLSYKYRAKEWLDGQMAQLGAANGRISELEEKLNELLAMHANPYAGVVASPVPKLRKKPGRKAKIQEPVTMQDDIT